MEPVRIRPGTAGLAADVVDQQEAVEVRNLLLARDGTWTPRLGLSTRWTGAEDVVHVSNHPNGQIMTVSDENLYMIDPAGGWSELEAETGGWPTAGVIRPAQSEEQWLAAKVGCAFQSASAVRAVDTTGAVVDANIAWQLTMLDTVNRSVIGGDYNTGRVHWSDDANPAGTWQATHAFKTNGIGYLQALVAVGDSQVLTLGEQGTTIISAQDSGHVSQQNYRDLPCAHGGTAAKCGEEGVLWLAPNGYVRGFRNVGDRIDVPINAYLAALSHPQYSQACHIADFSWYALANLDADKTFLYDLNRRVWHGTIDKHLVGAARTNLNSSSQFPVLGMGRDLVEYGGDGDYKDAGANFDVVIECAPWESGSFEIQKQIKRIYLDLTGSWVITILGRDSRASVWAPLWSKAVTGTGWHKPDDHLYHQRKIVLSATAADGVSFREMAFFERPVRWAA